MECAAAGGGESATGSGRGQCCRCGSAAGAEEIVEVASGAGETWRSPVACGKTEE